MRTDTSVDAARSAQMSLVRGMNTKPEVRVRRFLHAAGLRFRLHGKGLPGKPDIVFPSRRLVVFVHGCFWHRHSDPACKLARLPKSRLEFWQPKLDGNRERDERNRESLAERGWQALVVWECQSKDGARLSELAEQIKAVQPRQ